jgi:hypothetical protein
LARQPEPRSAVGDLERTQDPELHRIASWRRYQATGAAYTAL